MFTPESRERLRSELLEAAQRDARIGAAAITGSAAEGREDRWSDIDLAFGVADAAELQEAMADWTARMYGEYAAVHHCDVPAGAWIYRVFLLADTLQVDIAFVAANEFRALAPAFRLVFGEANEPQYWGTPKAADMVGPGWLYALHVRSAIERGKFWQAEFMISGVRDTAMAMACVRCGVPAVHGKGMDSLPESVREGFTGALVRGLDAGELARAFRVAVGGFLDEVRLLDEDLAGRLASPLNRLAAPA